MAKEIQSIQEICLNFVNNRSESSFKKAVDRLKPGIAKHLMKIEDDYETRTFIMNVAFAKMWTEIEKYDADKGNFSTWIYRIAWNEALQQKRYSNKHSSLDEMIRNSANAIKNNDAVIELPIEYFDEQDDRDLITLLYDEVIDVIKNLPSSPKYIKVKEILTKRVIEGKKYKDIAKELGIPENTAKGRFKTSKKVISEKLKERNPELVIAFEKFIDNK